MLYSLIKPLLFTLTPETAHELTLSVARLSPTIGRLSGTEISDRLAIKVGSNLWKSPIGLAAGLDKNAEALPFLRFRDSVLLNAGPSLFAPNWVILAQDFSDTQANKV